MKQTVFILFFFLLAIPKIFANDSLTISLSNQYKKHIKNAKVKINNVDYETDKTGHVVIGNPATDSINIIIEGYDSNTFAVKDISTTDRSEEHTSELQSQ